MAQEKTKVDLSEFKKTSPDIQDVDGAPKGLLGVKTPSSPGQVGDIEDRLKAAGIKPMAFIYKK